MPRIGTSSQSASTALFYITTGALCTIWTLSWYFFFTPEERVWKFICFGLFSTGIVFLVIGFSLGRIGREIKKAELPPKEETAPARPVTSPTATSTVTATNPPAAPHA